MKPLHYISIIFALFAISCTGSKRMAKKANELQDAGLHAEAAGMFLDAVRRNRNNVEAKIGLKKTGQRVLNDQLSEFFKSSNFGNKEEAVNKFLDAKKYLKQVAALGVVLEIPDHYEQDYARLKDSYLHDLYDEGQNLMGQERYAEAEEVFARIAKLDPRFKDTQNLQDIAYLEPIYQQAKNEFALKHYRTAYDNLARVIARDAGYKDAYAMQKDCVELGKYSIAVSKFKGNGVEKAIVQKVSLFSQNEMANLNDPFIKVVDRENIERILKEQQLALSGVVDDASAVQVGNLLGAQAVLLGEVVSYKETRSQLRSQKRTGFLRFVSKRKNPETGETEKVTNYKRTTYSMKTQQSQVRLVVSYKLISMETGEILFSKLVEEVKDDRVEYAAFSGEKNNLYPSGSNGQVNTSSRALKELRRQLSARRILKSTDELRTDAVREVCGGMAYKVKSEVSRRMQ